MEPFFGITGIRVVRGPNWKWGNQDAGEGYVGTVVKFKKNKLSGLSGLSSHSGLLDSKVLGVVSVIWDCGIKNDYRIGHEGAFDLRVVDNSATGVKHTYTSCIQCCAISDIIGIRWHCEECDGSICSSCFFQDKHDKTHTKFKRYETPNADPVDVELDPMKNNERMKLKGMFQGARVKRGPDWENGDEDVVDDVSGVGWVMESRNQAPGMVQVKWQNGQTYPYRLSADGKVDLQLVKVASGGFYHPEHLPVLKTSFMNSVTNSDGEVKFAVGDRVQIFIGDEEKLKKFQDGHGGYVSNIKKYIRKPGTIRSLNEVGVIVIYEDGNFFNLNPEILLRLSPFSKDQPVRIKDDEATIRVMENKFGKQARKWLAGETGRVVSSSEENDYIEVILDSDKKNEIKHLHRDWVEILRGDPKVIKKMAKFKSKMISAFVQAAASGQLNNVQEIFTKYPINIDAKNDSGETAMHLACRNGHLEIIKELYFKAKEKGFAIFEQQDGDGKRPIHYAIEGCHWKVLTFLIAPEDDSKTKGADLNVKDNKGLTPLQMAIRAGCLQSAQLLIENGSDINSQDSDGDTALHNAITIEKQYYRDPEIVSALMLSNNINLKLQNKRGFNPLLLSVAVKNRVAFNDLLKVGGEELANEVGTENKFTVIHFVCHKGELLFAKDFLRHVSQTFENKDIKNYVEKRCKGGYTPLSLAVIEGHYALVELLVEKFKANVKVEDDDGDNPVHLVAMKLDKLTEEPNPKTSPAIFKIHSELKEQHKVTITSYPGLSLMCYLISKGCPWKKTRNGKAKAVINNEFIRVVLETYGQQDEESIDIENVMDDDRCILCSNRPSVFITIEECGHVTDVACSQCFHSRLRKCPTCRQPLNNSFEQSSTRFSPSLTSMRWFDSQHRRHESLIDSERTSRTNSFVQEPMTSYSHNDPRRYNDLKKSAELYYTSSVQAEENFQTPSNYTAETIDEFNEKDNLDLSESHENSVDVLSSTMLNLDGHMAQSGATPMKEDETREFHSACRNGHLEKIKEMFSMAKEKKLNVLEEQDEHGRRAVHHAAEQCQPKVLAFLIKPDEDPDTTGANLNAKDHNSVTPLHLAVHANCLKSVKLLVKNGADVNFQNSFGYTALHSAIIMQKQDHLDAEIINALLSCKRIDLKLRNKSGFNALELSVAIKNLIAFDLVLRVGGEELAAEEGINDDDNKYTVLHFACYKDELQFVQSFLEHAKKSFAFSGKAVIEKKCKGGMTALSLAVSHGRYSLVELLVEKGRVNVNHVDDNGKTPVEIVANNLKNNIIDQPINWESSPTIFKIHKELEDKHATALRNYPCLSLMCYLVSKGCQRSITDIDEVNIINDESLKDILKHYESLAEKAPVGIEKQSDCIMCAVKPSEPNICEKSCGFEKQLFCSDCFNFSVRKCPGCKSEREVVELGNYLEDFNLQLGPYGKPNIFFPETQEQDLENAESLFSKTNYFENFNISNSNVKSLSQVQSTTVLCNAPESTAEQLNRQPIDDNINENCRTGEQPATMEPKDISDSYSNAKESNQVKSVSATVNDSGTFLSEIPPTLITEEVHKNQAPSASLDDGSPSSLSSSNNNSKYIECRKIREGAKGNKGTILLYKCYKYSIQRISKKNCTTWMCLEIRNQQTRTKCPATIKEEPNGKFRIGRETHDHCKKKARCRSPDKKSAVKNCTDEESAAKKRRTDRTDENPAAENSL